MIVKRHSAIELGRKKLYVTPMLDTLRRLTAPPALISTCAVVLIGCSSTLDPPSGNVYQDLKHRDPRIRVLAAREAVLAGQLDAVPLLIDNLSDRDGAVRLYTVIALKKLSGRKFGYLPHATPVEREEAISRWRTWAADNLPDARHSRPESGKGVVETPVPVDVSGPHLSGSSADSSHGSAEMSKPGRTDK